MLPWLIWNGSAPSCFAELVAALQNFDTLTIFLCRELNRVTVRSQSNLSGSSNRTRVHIVFFKIAKCVRCKSRIYGDITAVEPHVSQHKDIVHNDAILAIHSRRKPTDAGTPGTADKREDIGWRGTGC